MSVTVNGTEGITLDNGSADGAQVTLTSSGYSNWNLDNYSGRFRAYYNATERFTIDTSGNVGIGTSSPSTKLDVNGSIKGTITSGTAVSASGTSVDFTSIPSWVKRITVMLTGVSTNGTSNQLVQLGSGSAQTSGYVGIVSVFNGAALGASAFSSGFTLDLTTAATDVRNACLVFTLLGSNTWVCMGTTCQPSNTRSSFLNGYVTLSNTLDRVRITTVNGTDTFDAGSINILYEG